MRRALPPILALLLAACGLGGPSGGDRIVVFAAASLTDAFEELAAAYESATGVEVVLSFDASSALRAQISEGAPADVFAAADEANPRAVGDEGLSRGAPRRFAANGVAIVVPASGEPVVQAWTDLAQDGVRIVAAGDDVPITRYATELVAALGARPEAAEAFAERYAANVVSREDNVRAVLAKVGLGEGDVGIVYETDAAASEDVRALELPEGTSVVADYAFVVLADAGPQADAFADWLLGPDAQRILAAHGFRPPSG